AIRGGVAPDCRCHTGRGRGGSCGARGPPALPRGDRVSDGEIVRSSRLRRAVAVERNGEDIVGDITDIETIATGRGIRRLKRLRKRYGGRRWRKLKGIAIVRVASGSMRRAEIHWYEANGVGRKGLKIKRFL